MNFFPLILLSFNKTALYQDFALVSSHLNTRETSGKMYSAVGSEMTGSPWQQEGSFSEQRCLPSQHFQYVSHRTILSFFSLIFSSCEPIRSLTPHPCVLPRYLGIHYLRSHFPRAHVCVCMRTQRISFLLCCGYDVRGSLTLVYKDFLLLMQQLVYY